MFSDGDNAVLTVLICILLLVTAIPCESADTRQVEKFSDIGVPMSSTRKIDIYYVALQDQGHNRPDIDELKKRSFAKLSIQCGARCSDSVPRIVGPIMGAKKILRCSTFEIEFIIDFENSVTVAVTRDRRTFWYDDMCFRFESESTGRMLYGVFGGLWGQGKLEQQ